jgi:hypothetical protein
MGPVEHARLAGRLIGVVLEDVPAAELDVLQIGQRDELFDPGTALFRTLAETDRPHLGQRADRLPQFLPDGEDPGDERRRDSPDPGDENAELTIGGLDVIHSFHLFSPLAEAAPKRLRCAAFDDDIRLFDLNSKHQKVYGLSSS